jgi:hypothetical protein
MDKVTLSQFKRIIFFFRKKANSMPQKSDQLKTVFSTLDKVMGIMDKEQAGDDEAKE